MLLLHRILWGWRRERQVGAPLAAPLGAVRRVEQARSDMPGEPPGTEQLHLESSLTAESARCRQSLSAILAGSADGADARVHSARTAGYGRRVAARGGAPGAGAPEDGVAPTRSACFNATC